MKTHVSRILTGLGPNSRVRITLLVHDAGPLGAGGRGPGGRGSRRSREAPGGRAAVSGRR
ncbi:hypothetical protein [Streptomyces carminius]|uniref:hypothetical protein n=1 Tax=Streptomyces carminius TaxID=2665496 RepID=UPI0038CD92A3